MEKCICKSAEKGHDQVPTRSVSLPRSSSYSANGFTWSAGIGGWYLSFKGEGEKKSSIKHAVDFGLGGGERKPENMW